MIRLGLVGYPLNHSLSPILHNAALQASGLEGKYSLYPIQPQDAAGLREVVNGIRTGELTGLNVTIPYKQAVIPFLAGLTSAAAAIGAVNTIYLQGGKVVGDNTDFAGFLADLDLLMARPQSALVLGAGGAARAVTYALWSTGCEVTVAARRAEQARDLAGRFPNVKAMELGVQSLRESSAGLIVNATPVGMFPDVERSPWPEGLAFPKKATIYDLVYNPPETQLLREARAAGLRGISGLGMLIEQAALAFELWTGYKIARGPLAEAFGQTTR